MAARRWLLLGCLFCLDHCSFSPRFLMRSGSPIQTKLLGYQKVHSVQFLHWHGLFTILVASILFAEPKSSVVTGLRAEDVTAFIKNNPDARNIVQKAIPGSDSFQVEYSPGLQRDD